MSDIDKETGIWSIEVAKKRHRFDPELANGIIKLYHGTKSIADVGCGNGSYCRFFKEAGVSIVHGYEGTPNISSLGIYDDIMVLDLTKIRYVNIKYETVISIEVGEHIPKEHEQVFIDNVCQFVNKDLVLSWAIPGQGGKGHFNEQPNDYVISEFVKRGLVFDEKRSKDLRKYSSLKWFRNTILVFENK